jgi:hypothetical protein
MIQLLRYVTLRYVTLRYGCDETSVCLQMGWIHKENDQGQGGMIARRADDGFGLSGDDQEV